MYSLVLLCVYGSLRYIITEVVIAVLHYPSLIDCSRVRCNTFIFTDNTQKPMNVFNVLWTREMITCKNPIN